MLSRVVVAAAVTIGCYAMVVAGGGKAPAGGVTSLPTAKLTGTVSIEEAIARRRSVRSFAEDALTEEQIGQLLWAAQGITDRARGFRAAPSAGALYPLELFVVKADGVFRYIPAQHALRKEKDGDMRGALSRACLGQGAVSQAPVSIVITAVYERTAVKYRQRSERYINIEAGCAAENVFLEAAAMGLGSVAIGAFDDRKVEEAVGARQERAILVIPAGRPRE